VLHIDRSVPEFTLGQESITEAGTGGAKRTVRFGADEPDPVLLVSKVRGFGTEVLTAPEWRDFMVKEVNESAGQTPTAGILARKRKAEGEVRKLNVPGAEFNLQVLRFSADAHYWAGMEHEEKMRFASLAKVQYRLHDVHVLFPEREDIGDAVALSAAQDPKLGQFISHVSIASRWVHAVRTHHERNIVKEYVAEIQKLLPAGFDVHSDKALSQLAVAGYHNIVVRSIAERQLAEMQKSADRPSHTAMGRAPKILGVGIAGGVGVLALVWLSCSRRHRKSS